MERLDDLLKVVNHVVGHKHMLEKPVDRVIYSLGRIGADEFKEIVTNAANG